MMLSSHIPTGKVFSGNNPATNHRRLLGHRFHRVPLLPFRHQKRANANVPAQTAKPGVRASLGGFIPDVFGGDKTIDVKAVVTVKLVITQFLDDSIVTTPIDIGTEVIGRTLALELVSSQLDPDTGSEKTVKASAHRTINLVATENKYEANFSVPKDFGEIGAVMVENQLFEEMFIADIVLDGLPNGSVTFTCDSWVHSTHDNPTKRIFFSNKSYLPSDTPNGLKKLREAELKNLRGNGEGERKKFERIYDYDAYNDLGDPDKDQDLRRPVLGSDEHPYPRRCRTGRPRCETDPSSEKRSSFIYLPKDESFAEVKLLSFGYNTLRSALKGLIPSLESYIVDKDRGFPDFESIDNLFERGIKIPKPKGVVDALFTAVPRLVKSVDAAGDAILRFDTPSLTERDRLSWVTDEEFAREMVAGLNPTAIQLVTDWPLKSELDSKIYGPPESLITKELVEEEIKGFMTLEEALEKKRLFVLDYHDSLLPYVNKVREIKGRSLYASRTLLFANDDDTLRPIAIELTRPPNGDKPQWKQVFRRSSHSSESWLWKLAKSHVAAHDEAYHQVYAHWLRTHCCTEPYIIAANRQLSAMHPIYRLLKPYFRYTMEINKLARELLVNAGGIIESTFSFDKYSMEFSSFVYDKQWRFDMEGLPADLIRRGMAVEDPTAKHGLKLTIEDYPYASDGLILWDAIKDWITEYVNYYYPQAAKVESDTELQAWWTEVRTKGHADKKDEPWWPVLKTQDDLIQVLCTIAWVTAGLHAAVNFGQYPYGGYFPNRPTNTRRNIPTEDPEGEEYKNFIKNPESALLDNFPSQIQATKVMTILNVLSGHSPDEEYIGEKPEPSWADNPFISAAFGRFNSKLKELDGIIDARNKDNNLKNRTGAGIVPYELLKPVSETGVTGKGVPNSISI